jgi:hypothetical protein
VNLGQHPFIFQMFTPVSNWCFLTAPSSNAKIASGIANSYHLLHFFETSPHGYYEIDAYQAADPLGDGGVFEVSCLFPVAATTVATGLAEFPTALGRMVGWEAGSIGIHTDDGCVFRGVSTEGSKCWPAAPLGEGGETLAISCENGVVWA